MSDQAPASGATLSSFRVLRQSAQAVDYLAEATIRVSRDGSSQTATLALSPVRATLRSGQAVSFDFDFRNSLD